MNVLVPQQPYTVQTVVPQPPHIEAVSRTREVIDHGDHSHQRTVNHIDVHQPAPVVENRVVQPPPLTTRVPIVEHVKVRVPFTYNVDQVREHVDVEKREVMVDGEEEYEDFEEEVIIKKVVKRVPKTIYEEIVEEVPETVSKKVIKKRPVKIPQVQDHHVVRQEVVSVPVTEYEDRVMEVTTH